MPLSDSGVDELLAFLANPNADTESFIRGFAFGGLIMALGLQPVVAQIKAIFVNKDATISQLQAALATANANAIQPVDQAALADLQQVVVTESLPVP